MFSGLFHLDWQLVRRVRRRRSMTRFLPLRVSSVAAMVSITVVATDTSLVVLQTSVRRPALSENGRSGRPSHETRRDSAIRIRPSSRAAGQTENVADAKATAPAAAPLPALDNFFTIATSGLHRSHRFQRVLPSDARQHLNPERSSTANPASAPSSRAIDVKSERALAEWGVDPSHDGISNRGCVCVRWHDFTEG